MLFKEISTFKTNFLENYYIWPSFPVRQRVFSVFENFTVKEV